MKKNHQGVLVSVGLVSLVISISMLLGTSAAWAIVVTNTNDSGPGSLRHAIGVANGDLVPTSITFDATVFPGTITLQSPLQNLIDPGDTIDGGGIGVVLDGSLLLSNDYHGLRVRASNITISGLTIQNFGGDGIRVQPLESSDALVTGVVISNNLITSNGFDGVRVEGGFGPDNMVGVTIANNTLSDNGDDGIQVRGSFGDPGNGGNTVDVVITNNLIQGSKGKQTGGLRTGDGIRVMGAGDGDGSNNTVTAIISENIVKNNADDGIIVPGAGLGGSASNNTVYTEIIGNHVTKSGGPTSLRGIGIVVRGGHTDIGTGSGNIVTFIVENNTVGTSKMEGIRVTGGVGSSQTVSGSVINNNVSQNGADGIQVVLGPGGGNVVSVASITDNNSDSNVLDGIRIGPGVPGDSSTVSGNRTNKNGEDGIHLYSTGYYLEDNSANKNVGAGIKAPGNVNGGGNTAKGNGSCNTPGCF